MHFSWPPIPTIRCCALLLAACLLVLGHHSTAAEKIAIQPIAGTINWIYSYPEGRQRARQSGKPLFVVFRCEP